MMVRSICITTAFLLGIHFLWAQTAKRYDIVIDELFPDPTPVVGLPSSEFIELKNVSSNAFSLKNWKLSDGVSTATITSNLVLKPDSFVVICPTAAVSSFAIFGNCIGVTNFPSLNNDGDLITLYSPEGVLIHAVDYNTSWYRDDIKSNGGWTLEMIDTRYPCGG